MPWFSGNSHELTLLGNMVSWDTNSCITWHIKVFLPLAIYSIFWPTIYLAFPIIEFSLLTVVLSQHICCCLSVVFPKVWVKQQYSNKTFQLTLKIYAIFTKDAHCRQYRGGSPRTKSNGLLPRVLSKSSSRLGGRIHVWVGKTSKQSISVQFIDGRKMKKIVRDWGGVN